MRTRVSAFTAVVAVAMLGAALPAPASQDPPASSELGDIGGLQQAAEETVADSMAAASQVAGLRPAASGPRIALVSTGVDLASLPEALRSQVAILGNSGDPVGFGTYVASVLFQLVPDATITSIGIYPGGRFNPWWQVGALDWLAGHTAEVDAVLYAFPPSEFLDPVQASMVKGEWRFMSEAISNRALAGSKGPAFGVPLWGNWRSWLTRDVGVHERAAFDRFAYLVGFWEHARYRVRQIRAAGVAVVAPAGDIGPGPQTILGVSALPEVITVGAGNGSAVSSSSASGPSLDGSVKPDLVAPSGLVGLLPAPSTLARALKAKGLLDATLEPAWQAGESPTTARTRLDSTIPAAAVVAAAVAGLAAQGVRNVDAQRGALTAASVPLGDVPVWRQGAGLLRTIPDAAFAGSRTLALAHGSLGLEPAGGAWTVDVPLAQGTATAATVSMTDHIGVEADGANAISPVEAGSGPPVSARASEDGVELSVPLGEGSHEAGLYCGYSEISVPGTGATADPQAEVDGVPAGTEQIPTCLVDGTRLRAHGFYIHDQPAEDLTFALLPSIPAGRSILHDALMFLPVDALSIPLFFRVTESDGNAHFSNVPPGYYTIRQFSDYGSPVTSTVTSSSTGAAVPVKADIGSNPGYQSFDALVLSSVCSDQAAAAIDEDPCTRAYLESTFGKENVEFEPSTLGYLVGPKTIGEARLRVVLDRVKKMPGANVSSRYVDLLAYRDLRFVTAQASDLLRPVELPETGSRDLDLWDFQPGLQDPDAVVAKYAPASSTAVGSGIARYPFRMTQPNYKAHMSLNFSYDVTNAYIVVVVQVGLEFHLGVITPQGTFQLPAVGPRTPVNLGSLTIFGHGEGKARFDFQMLPRGAGEGTIWFVFVPPNNSVVSTATLGDLSFELDTWTNALWPGVDFNGDGLNDGHAYSIRPNVTAEQISDPPVCRSIDNGAHRARVCEDWTVLLHSPKDDAATVDLVDRSTGASIVPAMQAAGAAYFDPQRGSSDFSHALAWSAPSLAGFEATLTLESLFRTNGRFWEQLTVPLGAARRSPGWIDVKVLDNLPGSASLLFPHAKGPAPVAPYVPFRNSSTFLEP